jgi:hypothetical protein
MARQRLARAIAAAIVWTAVLFVGFVHAALAQFLGSSACEASPGDSNYGEFGWSLLPPGPTCTFTEEANGFAEVRGPGPYMSVWLFVLVVGGWVCVRLFRRARRFDDGQGGEGSAIGT